VFLLQRERPLIPAKPDKKPVEREPQHGKAKREPKSGRDAPRSRRAEQAERAVEAGMQRYRIEVGREHGVEAKHIVGAIANEAGMDSSHIGHIKFYDAYSTVDLPEGMPKAVFKHLKKVWVCGRQLQLSLVGESGAKAGKPKKPKKHGKAKGRSNKDKAKSGGKRSAPGTKRKGKAGGS